MVSIFIEPGPYAEILLEREALRLPVVVDGDQGREHDHQNDVDDEVGGVQIRFEHGLLQGVVGKNVSEHYTTFVYICKVFYALCKDIFPVCCTKASLGRIMDE